ncbi:MAG: adenylyl-sulfate kinase [Candidatus Nanoarchaeia archaeon]|nr:adenylyl-sulfate kinase [Candidatus Nanoarchaeia archaeon]
MLNRNSENIGGAKVLWFTGLSGSGKTSISEKLHEFLVSRNKKVLILDGDVIRNTLHKNLGFSPEDIRENNKLISEICASEQGNYDFILVPIISPFADSRIKARSLLGDGFIEIHINCPLETCMKRDVKGLYKKALAGEVDNFIGISENVPYETPTNPDIRIDTDKEEIEKSVQKLISFLNL